MNFSSINDTDYLFKVIIASKDVLSLLLGEINKQSKIQVKWISWNLLLCGNGLGIALTINEYACYLKKILANAEADVWSGYQQNINQFKW